MYKCGMRVKEKGASSKRFPSFEFSIISLRLSVVTNMIIICIYRRQEVPISLFLSDLETLIDEVITQADKLLITGDFNVWANVQTNTDCKKLSNLMNAFGLEQYVEKATHIDGNILDHVYINPFQMSIIPDVLPEKYDISPDHSPILMKVPMQKPENDAIKCMSIRYVKTSIWKFSERNYKISSIALKCRRKILFRHAFRSVKIFKDNY